MVHMILIPGTNRLTLDDHCRIRFFGNHPGGVQIFRSRFEKFDFLQIHPGITTLCSGEYQFYIPDSLQRQAFQSTNAIGIGLRRIGAVNICDQCIILTVFTDIQLEIIGLTGECKDDFIQITFLF